MPSKLRPALFLLPLLALAAGCGNSGTSSMTAAPNPYTFSGDWGAQLTPTISPATVPIIEFLGTLLESNGVVTGGLTPIPSSVSTSCLTLSLTPIPVSGTVDSTGNLTITLPVAGGTATLTAALSTNPETEAVGSYKIVGGTCAMPSTPMQIAQYAPLNGTYTGSFSALSLPSGQSTGITTTITAVLAQSTTANSSGQFPVSGTVTVTGACSATFTLSNSIVWGGVLEASDSSGSYVLGGEADPTATSLNSFFTSENSSTGCPFNSQLYFVGILTSQ
jgi:hypothetical protein